MSKQQEIQILQEAISKLGSGSYLGPWLSSVAHEVESLIRSDIFPALSLRETIAEASNAAKAIVEQATADAARIAEKSNKLEREALKECSDIRQRCYDSLHAATKALTR